MLLNLLSNALKYSQVNGLIKIVVSIDQPSSLLDDKYLKIDVEDYGIGIKPEDQHKLFKLFGTIKNDRNMNRKSIGLGLNLCKLICQQFDGDVTAKSVFG